MNMDLYRFFDADDRLLYIGISLHAALRLVDHRATKSWWQTVVRVQIEHHFVIDRFEMLSIERKAIEAERPQHNVVHANREPQHDPDNTTEQLVALEQFWSAHHPLAMLFKVSDVAEVLGTSVHSIYNQIKRKDIKAHYIGKMIRIHHHEVERLILQRFDIRAES